MELAPWSDHIVEPGPDSPLAVTSAVYHLMMRKIAAERDTLAAMNANLLTMLAEADQRGSEYIERLHSARQWARRWRSGAKLQRQKSDSNFVWGQQWQEYYRQKDALLAEVMSGYADVVQQTRAERDAYAAALTAIRDRCRGATNPAAVDAWDIADAALARGRAQGEG